MHLRKKIDYGLTRIRGVTLIELMVTVVLVSIILAVGIPSLSWMVKNNRRATQLNILAADMNLARSEAVKRNLTVTVCKRNSDGDDCDNSATWTQGWITFVDMNSNGAFDDDASAPLCEDDEDCLLRVRDPLTGSNTLAFPRNRVTYNNRGATGATGTFTFCDDRGAAYARAKIISNTGRLRASRDSNDDGVHEDGSGSPLTC